MTLKTTNNQWIADHLTIQKCGSKTNWVSNCHIGVNFQLKHRCTDISPQSCEVSRQILQNGGKTLCEEEKQRINALLEKHRPREEIQEKEMVVL